MITESGPSDIYTFAVQSLPAGTYAVRDMRGREALSKPYAFDVTVATLATSLEVPEAALLGNRGALTIATGRTTRLVPGVVSRVRRDGPRDHGKVHQTRVRLVPTLALLRHQIGSRIFQDLRVDEVVDRVLGAVGIPTRWELTQPLPPRPYTSQYRESDLAFVRRLTSEAGIYFWFDVSGPDVDAFLSEINAVNESGPLPSVPKETVVFSDDPSAYPWRGPRAPALVYSIGEGRSSARDRVTSLVSSERVRAEIVEYHEFDPARPRAPLSSRAGEDALRVSIARQTEKLEIFEHHGDFLFPDADAVRGAAKRIRARARRNARRSAGASDVHRLFAGACFQLDGHPIASENREHVVVSIRHRGRVASADAAYENTFKSVPSDVLWSRPPPKRKSIETFVTATVVGPDGEDIHVDAQGRVRVRFHWDRRAPSPDSSCWIRTMHPWAGAAFGHQFIPRVGMEVAISFEGGDPDRPVVTGALYNGTHPMPFATPVDRTRSGIRTQSSPGGGGFNELSFEDRAGAELLYLRAQRDLDVLVQRDATRRVLRDDRARIEGDRYETLDRHAVTSIAGNSIARIGGNAETHVDGDVVRSVAGQEDSRISGRATTRIEGTERRDVTGIAAHRYRAEVTTRVDGGWATMVGTAGEKRSWTLHAEGVAAISSTDGTELSSDKDIVLRVGKSTLRLSADRIELVSPTVVARGTDAELSASDKGLRLSSKGGLDVLAKDRLFLGSGAGATLSLKSEFKADGARILLNSPDNADDPARPPPAPRTSVELVDASGAPLAFHRFIVTLASGVEMGGLTDKEGKAELYLEEAGTISFPDLTDAKNL